MAGAGHRSSGPAGRRSVGFPGDELPPVSYERHAGAASASLGRVYRRREPEATVLHAVVREHLAGFLEEAHSPDGDGYPRFIEHEFRRYLNCGILARGFARLRCPACGHERLVGFSCKGRLCPSCTGRRMADIAADLVDHRLPEAPYRQWVLTFPWVLRFRLAVDRPLFSALIRGYLQTLFAWQRRRGRSRGIARGATGAVTFVQRFGAVLNLHPHLHSIVPDGLFVPGADGALNFVELPVPTQTELDRLTERIARRLTALVERHTTDEARTGALMEETMVALREAYSHAVRTPRLGLEEPPPPASHLCARMAGFTLHAGQSVAAEDRAGLERLCRYGLRSPFSQERLSRQDDGRVVYMLRRPWPRRGGVTRLVLEPHELLRRLAALTPAPYTHLVRCHGIFANRSKARRHLPAPPASEEAGADSGGRGDDGGTAPRAVVPPGSRRLPWAQLLRRVFAIDALRCPRCATPMVVLAFLSDPPVVARILAHLGLPAQPPTIAPARRERDAALIDPDLPVGEVFDELPDEGPSPDAPWGDDDQAPP